MPSVARARPVDGGGAVRRRWWRVLRLGACSSAAPGDAYEVGDLAFHLGSSLTVYVPAIRVCFGVFARSARALSVDTDRPSRSRHGASVRCGRSAQCSTNQPTRPSVLRRIVTTRSAGQATVPASRSMSKSSLPMRPSRPRWGNLGVDVVAGLGQIVEGVGPCVRGVAHDGQLVWVVDIAREEIVDHIGVMNVGWVTMMSSIDSESGSTDRCAFNAVLPVIRMYYQYGRDGLLATVIARRTRHSTRHFQRPSRNQ